MPRALSEGLPQPVGVTTVPTLSSLVPKLMGWISPGRRAFIQTDCVKIRMIYELVKVTGLASLTRAMSFLIVNEP